MDNLPPEMKRTILKNLPGQDLQTMTKISRIWRELATLLLNNFIINFRKNESRENIAKILKTNQQIIKITLYTYQLLPMVLTQIVGHPNLHKIILKDPHSHLGRYWWSKNYVKYLLTSFMIGLQTHKPVEDEPFLMLEAELNNTRIDRLIKELYLQYYEAEGYTLRCLWCKKKKKTPSCNPGFIRSPP